jgi:hypothetical protein
MHLNYISERSITGEDHIYDDVHTVGKNCTVNQTNKKLFFNSFAWTSFSRYHTPNPTLVYFLFAA